MINNKGKTALIFGVRNDSSISWHIAKRLHESGCRLALTYVPSTRPEVMSLLEANNMKDVLTCMVDVRNEEDIVNCVKLVHKQYGRIDYLLHGIAYGNHKVLCSPV